MKDTKTMQGDAGIGAADPFTPPVPPTAGPPTSARGEADPGLVAVALANDLGVEARWLAPVNAVLADIERLLADPAVPIEEIEARLTEAINSMPELLGSLNVQELANALEAASGPAAIQGLSDGLRAKRRKTP